MADAPPVWTVFSDMGGPRSSATLAALVPKRVEADPPAPPPDLEAVAAAARAAGRLEGEARAAQAAQAAIAAERDAAAAALAEARRHWVEAESATLASAFADQARMLETRLAHGLSRVLRPFLAEALRQEALRDVRAIVSTLLSDDQSGTLVVSGPADLVQALAERLDLPPGRLAFAPGGTPDLRIVTNGTVIETRLQAWAERVAALVEDR